MRRAAAEAHEPRRAVVALDVEDARLLIELDARASVGQYIEAAKQQRVWDREARLSDSDA